MPPSRPSRDPPGGHAAAEGGARGPVAACWHPQHARTPAAHPPCRAVGAGGGEAASAPRGRAGLSEGEAAEKPFIASMGIYVFRKDVLIKLLKSSFPKARALP
jgi:hypothetical protein